MRASLLVAVIGSAVLAGACVQTKSENVLTPTTPTTPTAAASYLGTWTSITQVATPSPSSCANFQWTITNQTADSMSGTFSATCAGGITIGGTASGQIQGTSVPITVTGTAALPGITSCAFSISGTGTLVDNNTLTIPYSGTSCLGPFHGTETLHRPSTSTTDPPPTPTQPRRDANSYGGKIPVDIAIGDLQSQVYAVAAANPSAIQASCLNGRNVIDFPTVLLQALRQIDNRWGYNCRRGNCADPSNDAVAYHWSPGPSENSTNVYIFDVIAGTNCGPQIIDETDVTLQSGTIGRYSLLGRFTNLVNY